MSIILPSPQTVLQQCNSNERYDVVVAGGGPAGLAAALALVRQGVDLVLIAPPRPPDRRTSALLAGSLAFLDEIGVGDHIRRTGTALRGIRMADGTGHLLKAPETLFMAEETGREAFGFNVANVDIAAALEGALTATSAAVRHCAATSIHIHDEHIQVGLSDGDSIAAKLVIGADGRASRIRAEAGIAIRRTDDDQSALVATVTHSLPHDGISTELHRSGGPLTTVPSHGSTSNIVWVERRPVAERLGRLGDTAFLAALQSALGSHLGRLTDISGRGIFALQTLTVAAMTAPRVTLVGEAAHVIPPIGAQGLNMGLADAAAIARLAGAAVTTGQDPGSPDVLSAYERERRRDVMLRTTAIDWLNRSLLSDSLPAHLVRGGGLALMQAFPPLKRLAMAAGLGGR